MPGPSIVTPRPQQPFSTAVSDLGHLLQARLVLPVSHRSTGTTGSGIDVQVNGVSLASDSVRPGDLFAAVAGARKHGSAFVGAAVRAGAVAVMTDADGLADDALRTAAGGLDVPVLVVDDPRRAAALAAAHIYRYPSRALDVVGITGTSGKTTTSFLVRAALGAAGRATGLVGTVGTFVGERAVPATLTTPEAPDLQALLAVMLEAGQDSVVMEVSSHALSLQRVAQVRFALAAFTNLSQDHLDFHADLEAYFEAKATLFDGRARRHLVVVDDQWGARLARRLGQDVVTVSALGAGGAQWTVRDVVPAADGSTRFSALGPGVHTAMGARIPGSYNVANALLALAIAVQMGVPADVAGPAIAAAQVPGRMERVDAGQDFLAVVDYSHKPAAVQGALRALRPLTAGRLIIVLGCGGDRDRGKRPLMGRVAATDADVVIVTDDNPRSESPATIRNQILAGARDVSPEQRAQVLDVGPRGEAIGKAVALARAGDTVLIAGKGHETGQDIAAVVHPFDDRAVLRAALGGVSR